MNFENLDRQHLNMRDGVDFWRALDLPTLDVNEANGANQNIVQVHIKHVAPGMDAGLRVIFSEEAGMAVAPAEQGWSVISTPVVFIADYVTGMELVARHGATVPVLIVTVRDRAWDVRHALDCGVKGYVTHLCQPPELVHAVRQLAAGHVYFSDPVARCVTDSKQHAALTTRESEVLQLLAEGHCNKVIARQLDIEVETVKSHVKRVMNKLGATARTHAVAIAAARGLVHQGSVTAFPGAAP